MPDIPRELLTGNRGPDPVFLPQERLFRRFKPNALHRGKLALDAVDLPDISVNRGKYSKPEWTLLVEGCERWGVAAMRARDIPGELPVPDPGVHFTFRVVHVPLKQNYSHTEIRGYRNGAHLDRHHFRDLDPAVHLRFRYRIQQLARIIIQPRDNA